MLLPLLGACAVVGPFWGSEWEPVQGLLPQDCRCRDPRCCGNLLVLCLFLIWQVRHFWYRVIRMRSSKKNISKVRGSFTFSAISSMIVPVHAIRTLSYAL